MLKYRIRTEIIQDVPKCINHLSGHRIHNPLRMLKFQRFFGKALSFNVSGLLRNEIAPCTCPENGRYLTESENSIPIGFLSV